MMLTLYDDEADKAGPLTAGLGFSEAVAIHTYIRMIQGLCKGTLKWDMVSFRAEGFGRKLLCRGVGSL